MVNSDRVTAVVSADSAPMKRLIQSARENNLLIDATFGRKTKAVIVCDSGQIVISGLLPDTLMTRFNDTYRGDISDE